MSFTSDIGNSIYTQFFSTYVNFQHGVIEREHDERPIVENFSFLEIMSLELSFYFSPLKQVY